MDNKKKAFAIQTLRRASYRWLGRYTALKNAKIGRNQYICRECGPDKIYPKKEVQLDHIESVVPTTGWEGFDSFIDRLLVDESGYQVLCKKHHEIKTLAENGIRKENAKKKRAAKNKPKKT